MTDAELEIDQQAFERGALWCVYLHSRPDGSVFYVGKGRRHRAFDFAPSRRTAHHKNIVAKYGRANIAVRSIPCATETEANYLERAHIIVQRHLGHKLVNLTDGGEGRRGAVTLKQQEALKNGRGPQAYARLSVESKTSILAGLARGRLKRPAWVSSPEGQANQRMLAKLGPQVLHRERQARCAACSTDFLTRSAKACCCSRLCEQRHRRARDKQLIV